MTNSIRRYVAEHQPDLSELVQRYIDGESFKSIMKDADPFPVNTVARKLYTEDVPLREDWLVRRVAYLCNLSPPARRCDDDDAEMLAYYNRTNNLTINHRDAGTFAAKARKPRKL